MTTTDDHDWFVSQLTDCVSSKFGMKWSEIVRTERLLYCDFVDPNADPRVYQEVEDIDKLKLVVNDFLEEHNAESKSPMPLVRARRLDVWRRLPCLGWTFEPVRTASRDRPASRPNARRSCSSML